MMTEAAVAVAIRSLETQRAVLKAQMKRLPQLDTRTTFADLHGILAGQASSTEEEIAAVRYHLDWESDPQE